MSIFEKALLVEKSKFPEYFYVSRNRKYKIKLSHITEFWLNGVSYVDNIYASDFQHRYDFENMLIENYKHVSKIYTSTIGSSKYYILKDGLLHSIKEHSLSINKNGEIIHKYFIDGREFSESDFNIYIRNNKLKRLLSEKNR